MPIISAEYLDKKGNLRQVVLSAESEEVVIQYLRSLGAYPLNIQLGQKFPGNVIDADSAVGEYSTFCRIQDGLREQSLQLKQLVDLAATNSGAAAEALALARKLKERLRELERFPSKFELEWEITLIQSMTDWVLSFQNPSALMNDLKKAEHRLERQRELIRQGDLSTIEKLDCLDIAEGCVEWCGQVITGKLGLFLGQGFDGIGLLENFPQTSGFHMLCDLPEITNLRLKGLFRHRIVVSCRAGKEVVLKTGKRLPPQQKKMIPRLLLIIRYEQRNAEISPRSVDEERSGNASDRASE